MRELLRTSCTPTAFCYNNASSCVLHESRGKLPLVDATFDLVTERIPPPQDLRTKIPRQTGFFLCEIEPLLVRKNWYTTTSVDAARALSSVG